MRITLTAQDRAIVEAYRRASTKIQAILKVRQVTGAGLKEAVDFLAEFDQELDPPLLRENVDMGMTAQVLAIGSFRKEVADHLEYPADFYADTQIGTPVICFLFECFGSSQSREMAACLGIDNPWDFNKHKFDPQNVDLARLKEMFEEEERSIASFQVLRSARFDFYFVPNG